MDMQDFFNIAIAVAGALGGWVLKVIWEAIKSVDRDVKELTRDVNNDFVRRDDFKESVAEIKTDMRDLRQDMKEGFGNVNTTLGLIFTKLDRKEDRENVRPE
jgi:hypothetical protein